MERKRRYKGLMGKVVRWLTIAFGLYILLYLGGVFHWFGVYIYDTSHLAILLAFILIFTFLNIPAYRGAPRDKLPWYDIILIILTLVVTVYIAVQARDIVLAHRGATEYEQVLAVIEVVLILEASRRAVSPILSVLGALFFVYPMFADMAPGFLQVPSWSLARITSVQYLYPTGILGSTMNVLATVIIAFILFGAFLNESGAGKAFIDLALALAGRFRGGAAKVSVLGSCLFGMINGSALANIATVGTITIPLMKSVGYRSTFAGAVEAVASTAGPMTPPVMGASIFIMMDFLGISYVKLMLVAAVPAFLYYMGLLMMIDHEAVKTGLKGLPPDQIPSMRYALGNSWVCVVPILVIIFVLVILHYTPATAAVVAIIALVLVSMLKKSYRMGPRKLANALAGSSAGLPEVGNAIAIAGIVMGSFNITGIGLTLSRQLVALAGGNLTLLVIFVAIACLIFGMGISGVAVYLLGAIFMVPAMIIMGVNPIAAHFFVLWISHAALITPPVCGAAFLAGAIAEAPLMATGWQACRLGIVVYLMSVFWAYDPALLLVGSPGHVALAVVTAIAGVYCASCAVAGRMLRPANWLERILLLTSAILLFFPDLYLSLIGLAVAAPAVLWQLVKARSKLAKVPQASG